MKLYYSPGACSISIHALLEEIGKPYETQKVDLRTKAQFSPDYVKLNPKSQVPSLLRDDGTVLTELVAIATWLAQSNPSLGLLPKAADDLGRVYEASLHVVTNVHPQGITRVFRTDKFTPSEADYDAVKTRGREIVKEGIDIINAKLHGGPFLLDHLSIADFVLWYIEYWTVYRLKWDLPSNCAAHYGAMMSRPSIQRTLIAEEYPFQNR